MSQQRQGKRRGEPLPSDSALVLRGDERNPDELAETAEDNFAVYGFSSVSVFAEVNGLLLDTSAAAKLARHAWLAVFTADDLLGAGLQLWDTGQSPHYDVVHEDKAQLVAQLVALLVGCPHRLVPNTHHQSPEGGA